MWETIKEVLTSGNALIVILFLMFVVAVGVFLVKSGYFSLNTEGVKIGAADNERNIIRQQQDYVLYHLKAALNNIEKPEGYDDKLGQLVIMAVYIEYVKWISFNHLSKSEKYISVKQSILVDLINQYTYKDEFKTDDFINYIKSDTKDTILELIKIRELYSERR